ncbi:MAG: hypothetical protein AB1384_05855 [Actinomycetota bacterium]
MDAHDFVTVSARREASPASVRSPEEALRGLLGSLVQALREGGCTMVGHIKGMLEDGGPSPLFFSVTSLEAEPQIKGGPLAAQAGLTLSITAIVAGIGEEEAARLLSGSLGEYLP